MSFVFCAGVCPALCLAPPQANSQRARPDARSTERNQRRFDMPAAGAYGSRAARRRQSAEWREEEGGNWKFRGNLFGGSERGRVPPERLISTRRPCREVFEGAQHTPRATAVDARQRDATQQGILGYRCVPAVFRSTLYAIIQHCPAHDNRGGNGR